MTSTWSFAPAGSDFDRAEQHTHVGDTDRDIGLDTAALAPLAETGRATIESADLTDRIDQAWITPLDCDDDYDYDYDLAD